MEFLTEAMGLSGKASVCLSVCLKLHDAYIVSADDMCVIATSEWVTLNLHHMTSLISYTPDNLPLPKKSRFGSR